MQSGAKSTMRNKYYKTALDDAETFTNWSTKQKMLRIVKTFRSQKSSNRKTDAKHNSGHGISKPSLLVGLQSNDEDSSTQVERVKVAVSDVRKTPTDTERRVDDLTTRMSHLETKHDGTDRKIKDVSSKTAQQIDTLEKRVRELENEMKKEKTERTEDTAALQARKEAEVSELKAKIRQVASEHTVMLLSRGVATV